MGSPGKKQFALRLDPSLFEEIERLAAVELRSSNAQIELLLREALKRRGIKPALTPTPRRGRPPSGGAEGGAEESADEGADAGADGTDGANRIGRTDSDDPSRVE